MSAVHYRTCNLCEAMCGIAVEHVGDHVVTIRGDADDPFSKGHICPKAMALKDLHEDPDRLRRPMRRSADRWVPIDWDTALDVCADRIVEIQERHGRHAVAVYVGNPTAHNLGALLFGLFFMKALGTFSRFSATSVDQLPHMLAALEMFGHQLSMPVPDVDRSDYMLMIGANPLVSNGSIMVAPGIKKKLAALRERGKLVVVDPRRTETAEAADEHHFIRPGSDGLFLAALLHTLYAENLVRPGRLADFTNGIDDLGRAMRPFSPEAVAAATSIEASTIRRLARELAGAKRGVAYGRIGVCVQRFGGLNGWLVNALNVVIGALDREGGMMFTRPAVDLVGLADRLGERGHFDKGRSRVSGLPEFGGEYPVVTLAEEIETAGEGQIKALVTIAGNPVLSTPNGARLERALDKLDFMMSIDPFCNETTRLGHFILPPTSQLQQGHYDLALSAFATRNVAKYSSPLLPTGPDQLPDWKILLELTARILIRRGGKDALAGRAMRTTLSRLGTEGLLDGMLRFGPYGAKLGRRGLSLKMLKDNPHGLDLGALEPCLPERLHTKDRRIALMPPRLAADLPRLERALGEPVPDLVLIGRRQLRNNNSWLHNSERMVKGRDRCTLLMHPDDAAARGLSNGDKVQLRTRAGAIEAPLEITDAMMRGVVSLPHGFGHDRPGVQLGVARAHAGVSINDVTDERFYDELSGTAALSGIPVEVEAAAVHQAAQ
jgi:anaerobic selenocysteine-containing dehydrogenase